MRVLLIEDDANTADFVAQGLREAGWQVDHLPDARQAMLRLGAERFDVIVLDRMLPGLNGMDALRLLRGAGIDTPVIMLTAMGGIDDRVAGLEAGADDYLVKPFAMTELIARLRSLGRRPPLREEAASTLELGDLVLDRITRQVHRAGQPLDLSPLEFRLLDCLLQHKGEVVTRTMLLEKVWGYRFDPKTSLVQTHMSRLRSKLDKGFDREMIQTVRGAGYVISAA